MSMSCEMSGNRREDEQIIAVRRGSASVHHLQCNDISKTSDVLDGGRLSEDESTLHLSSPTANNR